MGVQVSMRHAIIQCPLYRTSFIRTLSHFRRIQWDLTLDLKEKRPGRFIINGCDVTGILCNRISSTHALYDMGEENFCSGHKLESFAEKLHFSNIQWNVRRFSLISNDLFWPNCVPMALSIYCTQAIKWFVFTSLCSYGLKHLLHLSFKKMILVTARYDIACGLYPIGVLIQCYFDICFSRHLAAWEI